MTAWKLSTPCRSSLNLISKQDDLDVVETMKESLVDKFIDEHGCLDFGRSGGLSQQKEAKQFLNALQQRADLRQDALITTAELYGIADEIELKVKNLETFTEHCRLSTEEGP